MRNFYTPLIILFIGFNLSAQAIYETINSEKFQGDRELKIQLPRNYDPEEKRTYPLIIVLDGDYMFEPIAGNVDYQSYWEDIPDCIVVGIKHGASREDDKRYRGIACPILFKGGRGTDRTHPQPSKGNKRRLRKENYGKKRRRSIKGWPLLCRPSREIDWWQEANLLWPDYQR